MKELLYLKDDQLKDLIEKIFISYRETFSDSKKILTKYSIGLAHQKVIHLLSMYEGMSISELLKKLKVIVALGKVAFDNCLKIYKKKFKINKKFEFKHGKKYLLPDNKILIACNHPSPRNVNTKVVTPLMINSLFKKAKKFSTL